MPSWASSASRKLSSEDTTQSLSRCALIRGYVVAIEERIERVERHSARLAAAVWLTRVLVPV